MGINNKLNFVLNGLIIIGMIIMAIGFGYLAFEDKIGFIIFSIGLSIIAIESLLGEILRRHTE